MNHARQQLAYSLIVFCANFKVALRMGAYRANFGSLCSHYDVSTVSAFPNLYGTLFKNFLGFNVL